MSDRVSAETRSRIMSRVRARNTGLERRFRSLIWSAGIRGYRCHRRDVFGIPDVSWPGLRVAVFVDSAWWHGHSSRWTPGRLPQSWDEKIARNRERDIEVTKQLTTDGWHVVRVWDFEVDDQPAEALARVYEAVRGARSARYPSQAGLMASRSEVRHLANVTVGHCQSP